MHYWLVKSEPEVYSIDDLRRDKSTLWTGVRNYQARNFLREMEPGDLVLFYHSQAEPPGVAGLAKVAKRAIPDPGQFDKNDEYFDSKSTRENPRWFAPELRFVKRYKEVLALSALKKEKSLTKLSLLQPGSRLSVHSISAQEFEKIVALAQS